MVKAIILDNSILSAFETAGWFGALEFWHPDRELAVPRLVWEDEFLPYHDINSAPEWLSITEVDLSEVRAQAIGQLSRADWSCIGLAELYSEEVLLVTNDYAQKEVAEERGVATVWGTKFAIESYERCGITVEKFEKGVGRYIEDAQINEEVVAALQSAEKS